MRFEAALTEDANLTASNHLLHHFQKHEHQEDLCFALWHPSTGKERLTGLIDRIILPETGERSLHHNASFKPCYLSRAIELARVENAGLVFMHSHPGTGWQGLSHTDIKAERDAIAYPAGATELPLIGMTIGSDGYWSARFWQRESREMRRYWCDKVRIIGPKSYRLQFNDALVPPQPRKDVLKRTYDTWGSEVQNAISRMHVGIVGVGSVGVHRSRSNSTHRSRESNAHRPRQSGTPQSGPAALRNLTRRRERKGPSGQRANGAKRHCQ